MLNTTHFDFIVEFMVVFHHFYATVDCLIFKTVMVKHAREFFFLSFLLLYLVLSLKKKRDVWDVVCVHLLLYTGNTATSSGQKCKLHTETSIYCYYHHYDSGD